MSLHGRLPRLAPGLLILVGMLCHEVTPTGAPGTFTAFVPQALPQHAWGDFDEDGRPDVALIQDGVDGPRVSVRLSGAPGAVVLEATVVSVITADVDHDGDLDLVGAAPSGDVITWINDGHGHFTLKEPLHAPQNLSSTTSVVDSVRNELAALGTTAPMIVGPGRRDATAVRVSGLRPLSAPRAFDLSFLLLPSLRGPPLSVILN